MAEPTLLAQFDEIVQNSNSVPKMRELILQLAVQGRLVKQDSKDESVDILLNDIQQMRNNLIKTKKIKWKKFSSQNIEYNQRIPDNWKIEIMGYIFQFIDYRGQTPKKEGKGVRLITAKNVRMGFLNKNPSEFISDATYDKWMTRGYPNNGDLLFTTEAPLANVCILNTKEKIALAQRIICLHPFGNLNTQFFMYAIMSRHIQKIIETQATGMTATGIKASKMKSIPLPVPPLAEQHRIVARVEELMALCDHLEAQQKAEKAKCLELNSSALHSLVQSEDATQLAENWALVKDNFDTLYNSVEAVDKLQEAILQLAVQGRLVGQNPGDEPAGVLLEKIRVEKEMLIRTKKVKSGKPLPGFTVEEIPYKLPQGWSWCQFADALPYDLIDGDWIETKDQDPKGDVRLVQLADIGETIFKDVSKRYLTKKRSQELNCTYLDEGDILIARLPDPIGRACIYPGGKLTAITAVDIAIIKKGQHGLDSQYITYVMNSLLIRSQIAKFVFGISRARVSKGNLRKLLFPVPPLAEQHRIVARIEELMALTNTLKEQIRVSGACREELMRACVEEVVRI